jgi:hypothetical protein
MLNLALVEPFSYVLSGGLYLFQNSSYFYIKLNNYINSKYLNLSNKLKIDISVLQNANMENIYFYGNIPLNSIGQVMA